MFSFKLGLQNIVGSLSLCFLLGTEQTEDANDIEIALR